MADDANSPAPAAKGATPPGDGGSPGSGLTAADVKKMIAESNAAATAQIAKLEADIAKAAADHRAHIERIAKKASQDPTADPATQRLNEELEGLRRTNDELTKRMNASDSAAKSARLESAATRGVGVLTGLREGAAEKILGLIRPNLVENSRGEPGVTENGAFVPLADVAKRYGEDPFWQAPANRGGGGRSGERVPGNQNGSVPLIPASDTSRVSANIEAIAKGKVAVDFEH